MSAIADASDDTVDDEEIETLKAIYIKELEVQNDRRSDYPTRITLNLHPATADNADEQYVRLTLVVDIPSDYPSNLPVFCIQESRGLSDDDLQRIYDDLRHKADARRGSPMLYELIELAKEHLTAGNTPRCACAICLYGFREDDASFIKTECYHYFHSDCLRRYAECTVDVVEPQDDSDLNYQRRRISCPVCREPITYIHRNDLQASPSLGDDDVSVVDFVPDSKLLFLQRKMADLFVHQKSRGGIIDVEAERNKYLLEISAVENEPMTKQAGKGLTESTSNCQNLRTLQRGTEDGPSRRTTDERATRAAATGRSTSTIAQSQVRTLPMSHELREGRRAPKRGSHHYHHGRGRGQGRGGMASARSDVIVSGRPSHGGDISQVAIDSTDVRLLDDDGSHRSSSRVMNGHACVQQLPVNGQRKGSVPLHHAVAASSFQKCSANRSRRFHRPATTTATGTTATTTNNTTTSAAAT